MKKLKLFAMVMISGIITITASSSQYADCATDSDCPVGMVCMKTEFGYKSVCVEMDIEISGIKCFSCIHKKEGSAVVECSTCSLKEGWTDDLFCWSDRCSR